MIRMMLVAWITSAGAVPTVGQETSLPIQPPPQMGLRTLGFMGVTLVAATLWAAEETGPAEVSEPEELDWPATIERLDLEPAKLELVREADVNVELATLQMADATAPTDYIPTNPAYVPFVKSGGPGCKLVEGGLVVGAEYYTDRSYTLTDVPKKLQGLTLLQTKNGHKSIVDGRYAIVVRSSEPCYCFIALDERSVRTYERSGMPSWLEEFSMTKYRIVTGDPVMKRAKKGYVVLVRHVPGGRIAMGPNAGDPDLNSMYFAFFGRSASGG